MYCAVASMDTVPSQLLAGIFIILWLIISRVILYDLFVVILMDNFKVSDTIALIQTPGRINLAKLHIRSSFANAFHLLARRKGRKGVENKNVGKIAAEPQNPAKPPSLKHFDSSFLNFMQDLGSPMDGVVLGMQDTIQAQVFHRMLQRAFAIQWQKHVEENKDTCCTTTTAVVNSSVETRGAEQVGPEQSEFAERTLLIFHHSNIIRRSCIYIQGNVVFICLIYVSIFCSCFLLAAAPPAPDVPGQTVLFSQQVSDVSDAVFTGIFTAEMLINIIAQAGDQNIIFLAG